MYSIKELAEKTKKLEVLYVEDDFEVQQQTARLFKKFFPSLKTCDNGLEAWEYFQEKQPTILITDLKMPLMDGKKLIENVKGFDSNVTCIVLSGLSSENKSDLQADFILGKPTSLESIKEVLNKIVE